MKEIIKVLGILFVVIMFPLFMVWVFWKAWSFVLPLIYPTGPIHFIHPSYWLFFVAWFLITNISGGRISRHLKK